MITKEYFIDMPRSEARPFKVADDITMMIVDSSSGEKVNFDSKA